MNITDEKINDLKTRLFNRLETFPGNQKKSPIAFSHCTHRAREKNDQGS